MSQTTIDSPGAEETCDCCGDFYGDCLCSSECEDCLFDEGQSSEDDGGDDW
ncbi:hypothetical protein [Knoellia sp. p5-6-4]|uniref:hypothetical protein n=1 Tax=unclassified Knoellia TaxID=2618719 RepID=UPI0023DA9BAB|nr:hypothetical protein [Knoellia sp. p5-6-4]MDF2146351.1 hypothetical protein [Knoellia sp. p5-6-4]